VSARLRFAPGNNAWQPIRARGRSAPAAFCGPWELRQTKKGWSARRCVSTGDASYIRISGMPRYLTYPLDTTFKWGADGAFFPLPIPSTLLVPQSAHIAELRISPSDLQDIRRAIAGLRINSILPVERAPRNRMAYYSVNRPLSEQLAVSGVQGDAEFFYRLPSGVRFTVFQTSNMPAAYNPLQLFERSYQTHFQQRDAVLQHKGVVFEGVAMPFVTSLADANDVTLTPAAAQWTVTTLSHAAILGSTAQEDVYAGKPQPPSNLQMQTLANSSLTRMRFRARPGWIVMRQSYSDAWALPGSPSHAVADGYANAWLIPSAGAHQIFLPLDGVERLFYTLSAVCFVLFAGIVLAFRWNIREPA
jgi:hypothetical protein